MATTLNPGVPRHAYRGDQSSWRERLTGALGYCRRNPSLVIGLVLFSFLLLSSVIGRFFVNVEDARPISV